MMIFVVALASINPQHQLEAEILTIERRWNAAVAARDAATIAGILAEDFRFVAPDGSVHDRAGMLTFAAKPGVKVDSFQTRDVHVEASGDLAFVSGCFRQSGQAGGRAFDVVMRYVDGYRRTDRGWKGFYAHANRVQVQNASCP